MKAPKYEPNFKWAIAVVGGSMLFIFSLQRAFDADVTWRLPMRLLFAALFVISAVGWWRLVRNHPAYQGIKGTAERIVVALCIGGLVAISIGELFATATLGMVKSRSETVRLIDKKDCSEGYCQWTAQRTNGSRARIWLPASQTDTEINVQVWQSWFAINLEAQ